MDGTGNLSWEKVYIRTFGSDGIPERIVEIFQCPALWIQAFVAGSRDAFDDGVQLFQPVSLLLG